MAETFIYVLDEISIRGTDAYEYWGSFVLPGSWTPKFQVVTGTDTAISLLEPGECSIVKTTTSDGAGTQETIYYLLSEDNLDPYIGMIGFTVFLDQGWSNERAKLKERFGFPHEPTDDDSPGVSYTAADFTTMVSDGIAAFVEQGSNTDLTVSLKFSVTSRVIKNSSSNIADSSNFNYSNTMKSATEQVFTAGKTMAPTVANRTEQETRSASVSTTNGGGTSGMGSY